jgi:D-3-phosphoglycerate dehydrogenase/(S)-sulfolactate dehydrogenase
MKVLVADDLSAEGVEILRKGQGLAVDVKVGLKPPELKAIIGEYDALAVRSATKVTGEIVEAGKRLRVIGRAGVGVDNVDLEAATRRGIVVMNTPGGNTITVAELTVGMMMALSRHLPAATASMKAGKWEKKKFQGREMFGKTLGVVGLGNIGSVVVDRCQGMKMKVVAYDPFISEEAAKQMGVELRPLDDVLARADYLSIHVPLTDQTKNLINADALAKMRKGAFLVNCARGGIVDETALAQALASGQLAGASLDVFAQEPAPADHPLFKLDNFICTPHLGASTEEAQLNVAIALADQMVDYLVSGNIRNAVNAASVSPEQLERLGPWLVLTNKLGKLAGQLAPEGITGVELHVSGEVNEHPISGLTVSALKGLLSQFMGESVNEVNAPVLARERGIRVLEQRSADHANFASSVLLKVTGKSEITVEGTLFGRRDPRIVRVNQFELEAVPEGHLVALHNEDVPGVVGKIGTALGEAGVNIGRIHLSRDKAHNEAYSLINIDSEPSPRVLEVLRGIHGVRSVRKIAL